MAFRAPIFGDVPTGWANGTLFTAATLFLLIAAHPVGRIDALRRSTHFVYGARRARVPPKR